MKKKINIQTAAAVALKKYFYAQMNVALSCNFDCRLDLGTCFCDTSEPLKIIFCKCEWFNCL